MQINMPLQEGNILAQRMHSGIILFDFTFIMLASGSSLSAQEVRSGALLSAQGASILLNNQSSGNLCHHTLLGMI